MSKNGNLLLNLGPMADGTIPDLQKKAILGLGEWLKINGEGIYGTRPWQRPEGKTLDNIDLRFTQKNDTLYIHILDKPKDNRLTILSLTMDESKNIVLLGSKENLTWSQDGENIKVSFPKNVSESAAYVLKIF
ncbi:MAG: alpha-L-fucosidase C-terminal domain-containing protein [Promethearchaeota archaeon]